MYEPEENKAEVGADENSVNTQSSSEASEYSNVSVNLNLAAPLGDYPELQEDNMIWHSWSGIGEYKHYQLPMDAQRSLDWIREHTGYDVHSITKEEAAPPYWGKG